MKREIVGLSAQVLSSECKKNPQIVLPHFCLHSLEALSWGLDEICAKSDLRRIIAESDKFRRFVSFDFFLQKYPSDCPSWLLSKTFFFQCRNS